MTRYCRLGIPNEGTGVLEPYESTSLWQRTLGHEGPPEAREELDRLRHAYRQFRDAVVPLANEIAISVPQFTDHSIAHVDALWDTASLLIGDEVSLSPIEGFVLGGAFLLHDLGMGIAAYPNQEEDIVRQLEYKDIKYSLLRGAPDMNEADAHREALTRVLRLKHAERAEKIVNQQFKVDGEVYYLFQDAALRSTYGPVIGRIAHSHWFDVSRLSAEFARKMGPSGNFPAKWEVDPFKLACILRVTDAAQIDSRRAPHLTHGLRRLDRISGEHWTFQSIMQRPSRRGDRLEYSSSRPFRADEAGAWWLAYDTARMINDELRQVDALNADERRERLPVKSVAGVEDPVRFASFVQTDGWTPIDASLRTSNVPHVVETLGGSALYGDNKSVALRELISNAADATRARRYQFSGPDQAVWVSLSQKSDGWLLSVRDRGLGMTAEQMVANLTDFGSSRWSSTDRMREYPGLVSSGFEPTGRYGIGFFAAFMAANHVEVKSLRYRGASSDTHILTFTEGLSSRPILRQAEPHEQLELGGTQVRLRLNEPPRTEDGLLAIQTSRDTTGRIFKKSLRSMCALLDVDLWVRGPEDEDYELLLRGGEWKTLEPSDLYDLLYSDEDVANDPLALEMRTAYKKVFCEHLADITNDRGDVVGRSVLAAGLEELVSLDMWWWPIPRAKVYIGGMLADQIYNVLGAFVGSPLKADRNQAFPVAPPVTLQSWAHEQGVKNLEATFATPTTRYGAGELAMAVGTTVDELPCGYISDGFITPAALVSWLAQRDTVFIVGEFEVYVFSSEEDEVVFIDRIRGRRLTLPGDVIICDQYQRWLFPDEVQKRPVDGRFTEHVKTEGVDWDSAWWWHKQGAYGTCHLILEAAAEAWGADPVELGLGMSKLRFNADDGDTRLEIPCRESEETVRIDALCLRRPTATS